MIIVFFSGVLGARRAGLVTGALAAVCYSLLYLLVLSEEYALLFGALAMFLLLATIVVGTRKLDWYRVAEAHRRRT
jgi:inner membrane protein